MRMVNSDQINPLFRLPRIHHTHSVRNFVGAPRIELGPHAPKACILPLYYAPTKLPTHACLLSLPVCLEQILHPVVRPTVARLPYPGHVKDTRCPLRGVCILYVAHLRGLRFGVQYDSDEVYLKIFIDSIF